MENKTTTQPMLKVHFFSPIGDKSDYYFGSIKAIYAEFTPDEIGCTTATLYGAKIDGENFKVTHKCIISRETITRVANRKSASR